ncbi:MAG: YkgJ family cysteine cluster protein [Calditrichaeota bacterium]|nr:YkgJ family cysteine cluster protein [Calditrichota bacterium]
MKNIRTDSLLQALEKFYIELDQSIARTEQLNRDRLSCKPGCRDCCVDDITVFEIEAENIRRFHADVLKEPPHPKGACAFLDKNGLCRIYEHRPYVCRTQGLPLRWIEYQSDGSIAEYRDICPLNEAGLPVDLLPDDWCWDIGPFEQKLADIQMLFGNGNLKRIRLRALFKSGESP